MRRILYRKLVEPVRIPDPAGGKATHYEVDDYQVADGMVFYISKADFHFQYLPYLERDNS